MYYNDSIADIFSPSIIKFKYDNIDDHLIQIDDSEESESYRTIFIQNNNEELIKGDNLTNYITNNQQDKKPKLFKTNKKGRKRKNQKNDEMQIRCHNKYSLNNAKRKIIHSCNNNIYDLIIPKLPKKRKIYKPTIESQLGTKIKDYNRFFKERYYNILYKTIPKRYRGQKLKKETKGLTEEDKEKDNIYERNKKNIDEILAQDKHKILSALLNATFGDFFKAYLNDEKIIIINDIDINLEEFKTFGQCFNEGKDLYPPKLKEKYKKSLLNIYIK